jgi:hypothetical protein
LICHVLTLNNCPAARHASAIRFTAGQGEFTKAGKGGIEEGSNAPRASGGKGSQLSAIIGVFEDFWSLRLCVKARKRLGARGGGLSFIK